MAIDILYFAWVREGMGLGQERVTPPADVRTVADLIAWLAARGPHAVLSDITKLRAAIDQVFVPMEAPIAGGREVAIFPPVTGG